MTFADWYYEAGTSEGYDMPRIAPVHSGPFQVAIMLQDPGGPLAGSGAQKSREIGVTNDDATARFIKDTLLDLEIPLNEVVLINALPGYGLKNTLQERKRGAAFNTEAIKRAGVEAALVAGAISRETAKHIEFGNVSVIFTHHPSTLGHNQRGSNAVGKAEWRNALLESWDAAQS